MQVFDIPIILIPEDRRTLAARIDGGTCRIKIPAQYVRRRQKLVDLTDRIYWKLLAKTNESALRQRVSLLNEQFFQFAYHQVRYHHQFQRWGSCSSIKNINLSHRLIGAPPSLSDYVICHELAHLKYLNHGRNFWDLVLSSGHDPKTVRRELMEYGEVWFQNYLQWKRSLPDKLNF